ncbi:MAG: hypothetical protein KDD55_05450 [Bdellovibrionales bacterium]|nr:hypothetical protein [Bdellovibrionales bacterium]
MSHPPSSLLEQEAPGLFGSLKRSCSSAEELQILCDSYELSAKHGGKIEHGFTRKEGVSYNPRPARIGAILVKHFPLNTLSVVQRGMLACAPKLPERYRTPLVPIFSPSEKSTEEDLSIAAALSLDDLRHRHLRVDQEEVMYDLKCRAEKIQSFLKNHDHLNDLYTVLSAAIERYKR